MKTIPLSNSDKVAIVDDSDYEGLMIHKWKLDKDGYASRSQNLSRGGNVLWRYMPIHRELMGTKEGYTVDHINRDRLDNRRENMRFATVHEQRRNRTVKPGKHGYRGVRKEYNKYCAVLTNMGTKYFSYGHTTPESAALAYNELAKEHHGEFAMLNKL